MASAPPTRRSPEAGEREEEREDRESPSRVPRRHQRDDGREREHGQAIARRRRESDREDREKSRDRRGEARQRASPPGRRAGASVTPGPLRAGTPRRTPAEGTETGVRNPTPHPRWYSCSGATPVASSCRERIPSTAAVAADSVVRHGIESRSAAARIAASSNRSPCRAAC